VTTGSRHQLRGFSLLEITIVLALLGFVLTIGLKSTGAYLSAERRQTTVARLAGVDAALVNYVALQKRLPCPADGASLPGTANFGLERRQADGTCLVLLGVPIMNRGVVPWVTLGITSTEALDGWNNRITYRTWSDLSTGFTLNNALDMTRCAINGTENGTVPTPTAVCTQTCNTIADVAACTQPSNFLLNRGVAVQDGAGNYILEPLAAPYPNPLVRAPTGAAYVLISHGENRGGAYSSAGQPQTGSPANGADEDFNQNNLAYRSYNDVPPAFYVDAAQNDSADATHFDDILLHPTLMSVITRAQLGPRKVQ